MVRALLESIVFRLVQLIEAAEKETSQKLHMIRYFCLSISAILTNFTLHILTYILGLMAASPAMTSSANSWRISADCGWSGRRMRRAASWAPRSWRASTTEFGAMWTISNVSGKWSESLNRVPRSTKPLPTGWTNGAGRLPGLVTGIRLNFYSLSLLFVIH